MNGTADIAILLAIDTKSFSMPPSHSNKGIASDRLLSGQLNSHFDHHEAQKPSKIPHSKSCADIDQLAQNGTLNLQGQQLSNSKVFNSSKKQKVHPWNQTRLPFVERQGGTSRISPEPGRLENLRSQIPRALKSKKSSRKRKKEQFRSKKAKQNSPEKSLDFYLKLNQVSSGKEVNLEEYDSLAKPTSDSAKKSTVPTLHEDYESSESLPPVIKKPKSSISSEKISTYLSQSPEKLIHYESPGSASDSEDPLSSLFPSKYFSSISTLVFKLPKPCFSAQNTLSTACSSLSLRKSSRIVESPINSLDESENLDELSRPERFVLTDSRSSVPEEYHQTFEPSDTTIKLRPCSPSLKGNMEEFRTENLGEIPGPEPSFFINSKSTVPEESNQDSKKSERRLKSQPYMPILSKDVVELQAKKKSSSRFHRHLDVPVPEPVYYPFKCEWQGCPAELMNMEILRKHVYVLHSAKLESGGRRCLWKKCGKAWEAAVTAKDEDIKSSNGHCQNDNETICLRQLFHTRRQWKQHIEECHLIPFSWHMGDGPRGSQLSKQGTTWYQPYLYNADGFQITPSVAAQPIEEGRACILNARRFHWQCGKGIFGEEILVPIIDFVDKALP